MFLLSYCALRSGIVPSIILQSVHTNLCWQLMLVVGCKAEGTVGKALSIVMPTISGLGITIAVNVMQYVLLLLQSALQPSVGFGLLYDFVPQSPIFTLLSPVSHFHLI